MSILTALIPTTAVPAIEQALHGLCLPGLTVREAMHLPPWLTLKQAGAKHGMALLVSGLSPHRPAAPANGTGLYVQALARALRIRTGKTTSHEAL